MIIKLEFEVEKFNTKLSIEEFFEAWLFQQAGSEIEVIYPNGEVVGTFEISEVVETYKVSRTE